MSPALLPHDVSNSSLKTLIISVLWLYDASYIEFIKVIQDVFEERGNKQAAHFALGPPGRLI